VAPGGQTHVTGDGRQLPTLHRPQDQARLGDLAVSRLDTATLDRFYTELRLRGSKCQHCYRQMRNGQPPMRPGEVLIDSGVIYVPGRPLIDQDRTKNYTRRRVAVGPAALELLRAHRVEQAKAALAAGVSLAPDAYVFSHQPDGSKPIRPDGVSHRFAKLAQRLGVRCRLHDLRQFMVTHLVAAGVDVRTVAGRAGHVDGGRTTLSTYAHFQHAQDRHAAELLEGLLQLPEARTGR
jgi:hypothetical protein